MVLDFMRDHALLTVDLSFDDRYVNLVEQGVDVAVRMGRLADSSLGATYLGNSPGSWSRRPLTWNGAARPSGQALADHEALVYSTAQGDAIWHFAGGGAQTLAIPVRNGCARTTCPCCWTPPATVSASPCCHAMWPTNLRRGAILPLLEDWRLPGQEIHAVYPSPRMVPARCGNWSRG